MVERTIMQRSEHQTVKAPKLLPYMIAAGLLFVIIGMVFPEKEIWGGILAGFASMLVWLYSYVHSEFKEQEKLESFKLVVWTELRGLSRVMYDEAKTWEDATGGKPLATATEFNHKGRRLTAVFQLATTQANLNRLPDLGPIVAEGVIITNAMLGALSQAVQINFESDDDLFARVKETKARVDKAMIAGQMSWDLYNKIVQDDCYEANMAQHNSRVNIITLLLTVADRALRTATQLDKDGSFGRFQISTCTEEDQIAQGQEIADMNAMFVRYRKLREANLAPRAPAS
jgi:hypothetical protein